MRNGFGGPGLARHKRKGPALAGGGHRRNSRPQGGDTQRTYIHVPGQRKPGGVPHGKRPVNPGDYLTWAMLNRNVNAAAGQKFGAAIASNAAQQTRDAGWYDQYRQQILDAQARQQAAQAATVAQVQNLGESGTRLSGELASQQAAAMQADAAQRGAQVDPRTQQIAANAALIRQGLNNSFGAQLANMGQAENNYLGQQGIAAGQAKLEHLGQLSSAGQQLLRDRGDFKVTYRDQLRADSHKRALENKAFGLQVAEAGQKAADAAAKRRAELNKPSPVAWIPVRKWQKMSQSERRAAVKANYQMTHPHKKAPDFVASPVPSIDMKTWAGMSVSARNAALRANAQNTSKSGRGAGPSYADRFRSKYGVDPVTTVAHNDGRSTVDSILPDVKQLKQAGNARSVIDQTFRHGTDKKNGNYPKTKPIWVTVALDLAFLNGKISNGTAAKLHSMGYSVKRLGLKTLSTQEVAARRRRASQGSGPIHHFPTFG